ncbi:MAG TPA: SRPBCC family protein [Gemmatimonadaceae bacterium]|nr:SRPBCC family protein [Gemmatimonadaceae bacterium]
MGTAIGTATGTSGNGGTAGNYGTTGSVGSALGTNARPRTATTAPYQRLADADRGTGSESLSNFLGFFSIGLGLAEALAPGLVSRVVGIDHEDGTNRTLVRLMGLREISHGVAILSNQQPEKAVWSRVAGDALDLALLGKALSNPKNGRGRTAFATANVLAVTALDVLAARGLSKQPKNTPAADDAEQGLMRAKKSITVARPPEEVYAFWRNFENFPQFMRHLESVTDIGGNRSHWVAKAPAGKEVQWEAEITADVPNERISWRSVQGSEIYNAGTVSFRAAPGGRGTEVRVELEYDPPFGKLGATVAKFFREEPGQQIADDLRHFKQVMELGEIVLSDATKQRGMHPAQPDDKPIEL